MSNNLTGFGLYNLDVNCENLASLNSYGKQPPKFLRFVSESKGQDHIL